ncbi:hypothetical protein EJ04DRAFT_38497 [Polyplosphaeria fusca]|uniref:Uncharacterized protein n=1 Tax=Polyplosphaeria fusca TaxID=682080 RepID=A0A9P4QSH1_9PLEO|nr:hypothetical protein EJ04DRAFT_38497 [Polyplosphaeria fusca]
MQQLLLSMCLGASWTDSPRGQSPFAQCRVVSIHGEAVHANVWRSSWVPDGAIRLSAIIDFRTELASTIDEGEKGLFGMEYYTPGNCAALFVVRLESFERFLMYVI